MPEVAQETRDALAELATGHAEALTTSNAARPEATGLDARTLALVRIAILIALDAPPVSYAAHVADSIEAGATAEDILGVVRAVAPEVGEPRIVAAAPEIMLGLGIPLPEVPELE
jgi:alkylhydroperoxidase/carboxymuconolactone decarboxylase family protein YurZ